MLETNVNAKFLLRKNKQFSQTFSSLNKKVNTNRMFYIYLVKSFNTKMIFKRFQEFCVRTKIDTSNTELMFEFIFTYIFVDTLRFYLLKRSNIFQFAKEEFYCNLNRKNLLLFWLLRI